MFKNFRNIQYDILSSSPMIIQDRYNFVNLSFEKYNINLNIYQEYIIQDGDTPESVSLSTYQEHKYWFLILILNNKKDPFYDWPLTNDDLLSFSIKYVTNDYWEIQYQDPTYTPLDPTNINDPVVDNMIGRVFAQMERENDIKRHIFLPPKDLMQEIYVDYLRKTSLY